MPLVEKEFIRYSKLTRFSAKLQVCARTQNIAAAHAMQSGNYELANDYKGYANFLQMVSKNSINNTALQSYNSPNITVNASLRTIIENAKIGGDQPAMTYKGGDYESYEQRALSNLDDKEFILSDEEKALCDAEARERARPFIDNRSIYTQRVAEYKKECLTLASMEKVVAEKLEDSGVVMMYNFMPFAENNDKPNVAIRGKFLLQLAWIEETANLTGLDVDVVEGIVKNGLANNLDGKSINQTYNELRPAMIEGSIINDTQQNVSRQNEFITIAISIAKLIALVVSAVKQVISLVNQIQGLSNKKYREILDPSKVQPLKEDFNDNGIADDEETFFQTATAPDMLGLGGSLAIGIIPQIVSKNTTVRVVAGVIGAIGTAFFGNRIANPIKRWIVGEDSFTAEELVSQGYTEYNGEWYEAQKVADEANISVGELIAGGKKLYDSISGIFDFVKDAFGGDTDFFIGNGNAVNPGDV